MPDWNIYRDWLEETPSALYGAMRPQTGSQPFMDYWKGQQGNVWEDYWSKLGTMALGGQAPSLNYSDFLSNYPWMSDWLKMGPGQRGERSSLFAPRTRWNI